jgi:VanZ family protein
VKRRRAEASDTDALQFAFCAISTSIRLVVSFSVPAFLKSWLPVLAWMIFIFVGSTDLLSAAHTSRFIGPFFRWFSPDMSDATISSIQLVVRKCGHLAEYAILAVLLCRAWRRSAPWSAFVIATLYATLDEFHQSFVTARTGSPWDVVIDCLGAALGLLLFILWRRRSPSPVA